MKYRILTNILCCLLLTSNAYASCEYKYDNCMIYHSKGASKIKEVNSIDVSTNWWFVVAGVVTSKIVINDDITIGCWGGEVDDLFKEITETLDKNLLKDKCKNR